MAKGATRTNVTHLPVPVQQPSMATETKLLKLEEINSWAVPPFQRPVQTNPRVLEFTEDLKGSGGIITGTIVLGFLIADPATLYLIDGGQRRGACNLSGLEEFLGDVRIEKFETMADMAEEFIRLNSSLVPMRPDDLLRAYEDTNPALKRLREACSFVGYDNIRRSTRDRRGSILIGMSQLLRCWFGSERETPGVPPSRATKLVELFDEDELPKLQAFLITAHAAWGSDPDYYRLWSNLNVTMCMWMYRRLVISRDPSRRTVALTLAQFKNCLMSVSADRNYNDWLLGRNMSERDRSPCYSRLRHIFGRRIIEEGGKAPIFPKPEWFAHSGGRAK